MPARVVADLSLDKHILSEALRKKSDAHTAPRKGRLRRRDRSPRPAKVRQLRGIWTNHAQFWPLVLKCFGARAADFARCQPDSSKADGVGFAGGLTCQKLQPLWQAANGEQQLETNGNTRQATLTDLVTDQRASITIGARNVSGTVPG